ncbi:MAG TPA: hypothetical protein VNB23_05935, partial [Ramlibacter sp.]|nr:hypothetical protein [Ramlibacter sp.]
LRITTYNAKFHAHRAEIVRNGRSCGVLETPARIEHAAMASGGDAVALVTRPSPHSDEGYAVHFFALQAGGCSIARQVKIPLS